MSSKGAGARHKIKLSLVPPVAIIHTARAMAEGAQKYGAYKWRRTGVSTSVYIDAALRHIFDYVDGSNADKSSGVHPLGHAIASLAIILDAMDCGEAHR